MGCGGSKLEEASAAVNLCRSRCHNLSEAIRLRYALADAHCAYLESLDGFARSLHRFFLPSDAYPVPSPLLTLPPQRKGDLLSPPPINPHSNSGHIQFISSSSDDDDDDGPLHDDSSPSFMHHLHGETQKGDVDHITTFTTTTTTTTNYHFAKKGPPATPVTYEQRPFGAELGHVQVGDGPAMPSFYYPDPYGANQSSGYPSAGAGAEATYPYPYPYAYPSSYTGGAAGGIFGPAQPPAQAAASTPRPPPAPPSPPRASAWDFLNPFESYDSYFQNYTPSRSSRELREEEGIPDLEDEEQEVVIKEAYGDETTAKGAAASSSAAGGGSSSKGAPAEEAGSRGIVQEQHYKVRPGHVGESVEHGVHVVSRGVVGDELHRAKPPQDAPQRKAVPGSRSVPDVVNEIVSLFETVGRSCLEVSRMLEVGKQQYHRKKYPVVPSRIRYIAPQISMGSSSVPKSSELSNNASSAYFDDDEQKAMEAGNLSSTLQKLYIWEKKLLDEVKVEEDIRLTHERKSKKLRHMDERGAEPYKLDSIRHVVKKLSTKIRIEIQIVHSISNRISRLRDDELWPQLRELIHGLLKMWRVLSGCHRTQRQTILEARNLDTAASATQTQREVTMKLILNLLKWSESFFDWIDIQKSFVKELNEWLKKCLHYEPEVTADGVAPFSPGRLGAPPVFVICNYWSQVICMISEAEVVEAMDDFTGTVLVIWQQFYMAGHQRVVTPDMNRDPKALDRDNQKIQREVDAVNKKRTQVGNQVGYSHTRAVILLNNNSKPCSLHTSLQKFLEAMERFTESSLKAYEGLESRCEVEEMAAQGGART